MRHEIIITWLLTVSAFLAVFKSASKFCLYCFLSKKNMFSLYRLATYCVCCDSSVLQMSESRRVGPWRSWSSRKLKNESFWQLRSSVLLFKNCLVNHVVAFLVEARYPSMRSNSRFRALGLRRWPQCDCFPSFDTTMSILVVSKSPLIDDVIYLRFFKKRDPSTDRERAHKPQQKTFTKMGAWLYWSKCRSKGTTFTALWFMPDMVLLQNWKEI